MSLLEEYKENINAFTQQVEDKKTIIQQLEETKQVNETVTQDEQKTLEKKLLSLKQKLENERERLKSIDMILSTKASPSADENNQNDSSAFSALNDSSFDRNANIMSKSFNENMFFNRSKIEVSHFDFNLNLNGDGKEEDKVLNNAVAAETRNSTVINNSSRNNQLTDTETSNNASPLMMPKYHSLSSVSSPPNHSSPYKTHKLNGGGPATGVVPRQVPKHKRPLTRYLPNFSIDFNLRHHIETAGHQIQLVPHVIINGN